MSQIDSASKKTMRKALSSYKKVYTHMHTRLFLKDYDKTPHKGVRGQIFEPRQFLAS